MTQKTGKPTVDVIIPVFNTELYIAEALQSIENQTYPINKVFVINDGSTDKSKEKIFEYKKNSKLTIEYIETKNGGPAHARNLGIKASNADYISFHDADDVALPKKIELQMDFFKKHPSVLFTHTYHIYTDAAGNQIETERHYSNKGVPLEGDVSKTVFYKVDEVSTSTIIVSKKVFEQIGYFDTNMRHGGEDMDLLLRISKITNFGYIRDLCLKMRRHESNTTDSENFFYKMFPFYNKWLSQFPDDSRIVKQLRQNLTYPAYKDKKIYHFVKNNISKNAARKIFPLGSVELAILLRLPYWIFRHIVRRFKHLLMYLIY